MGDRIFKFLERRFFGWAGVVRRFFACRDIINISAGVTGGFRDVAGHFLVKIEATCDFMFDEQARDKNTLGSQILGLVFEDGATSAAAPQRLDLKRYLLIFIRDLDPRISFR